MEMVKKSGVSLVNKKPDVVIVFGGDGTLLKSEIKYPSIPKLLVSSISGSLGYLAAGGIQELPALLEMLKDGKYSVSNIMKLNVNFGKGNKSVLNEVFITSGVRGRSIKIELIRNENSFFTINCDGIIVFTPIGSTAYSLSCGGPILKTESIGITLLNPHLSSAKYFVLDKNDMLTLRVLAGEPIIVLDGGTPISIRGSIKVEKSKERASLISFKEKGIPEVCPPRVLL